MLRRIGQVWELTPFWGIHVYLSIPYVRVPGFPSPDSLDLTELLSCDEGSSWQPGTQSNQLEVREPDLGLCAPAGSPLPYFVTSSLPA
jgi:hypothetical protein